MANKKDSQHIHVNGTDVNIVYGDIFHQTGIKLIAFNEYFDTEVNDRIISQSSLNGRYILEYSPGKDAVDEIINSECHIQKAIVESSVDRPQGGKHIKYKLGTICPVNDYFLLAFSHFDDDNRAYLTLEDYISCLMHMWTELDILYAGRPINITLLGNGITRFNHGNLKPQALLHYIVRTFEISRIQFGNTSSLTIVLDDSVKDEINLYDINKEVF